jgi:hypothetical protein
MIRRYEGAAVAIGVGVVALLAVLVWRQLSQPRAVLDDDPALAAMETACSEKLHGDARTVSMTPDAAPASPATAADPGPAVGARASGDGGFRNEAQRAKRSGSGRPCQAL